MARLSTKIWPRLDAKSRNWSCGSSYKKQGRNWTAKNTKELTHLISPPRGAFLEETITADSQIPESWDASYLRKKKGGKAVMEMSSRVLLLFLYLNSGFWSRWRNPTGPLSHATGSRAIFGQLIESVTSVISLIGVSVDDVHHTCNAATIVGGGKWDLEAGARFPHCLTKEGRGNRRWCAVTEQHFAGGRFEQKKM